MWSVYNLDVHEYLVQAASSVEPVKDVMLVFKRRDVKGGGITKSMSCNGDLANGSDRDGRTIEEEGIVANFVCRTVASCGGCKYDVVLLCARP